jgi:hypothetical protein
MSVPLRKEEPEFDDEELTTADLAQGKRPAMSEDRPDNENRPKPVLAGRSSEIAPDVENHPDNVRTGMRTEAPAEAGADSRNALDTSASDSAPLFPNQELAELRARWSKVQTAFVDEPRSAVEQADGLVASAMKRLAEVFADERSKLEQQWDRGDNVSTEDLRIALQRYRSFFQRLLAI